MLLTNDYHTAFEYIKVIIQNTVNPDKDENGIFDDVTNYVSIRNDLLIYGEGYSNILLKRRLRMICTNNCENTLKFVKVTHRHGV